MIDIIQQTFLPAPVVDPTGSDEAYTPPWLVEAARSVLGAIDLDPASCARAQTIVGAATWYSEADNGLAQRWRGRMWLNPPFSKPVGSLPWVEKALTHWRAGDVSAALLLVRGEPGTDYNRLLGWSPALMCMLKRVDFWPQRIDKKTGRPASPDFGVLLWYLGTDLAGFRAVFDRYGPIR